MTVIKNARHIIKNFPTAFKLKLERRLVCCAPWYSLARFGILPHLQHCVENLCLEAEIAFD
jgi:hypothetical protein